jgi:hypothetical protein
MKDIFGFHALPKKLSIITKIAIVTFFVVIAVGALIPTFFPRPHRVYVNYGTFLYEVFSDVSWKVSQDPSISIRETLETQIHNTLAKRRNDSFERKTLTSISYNSNFTLWHNGVIVSKPQIVLLCHEVSILPSDKTGFAAIDSSGQLMLLTEEEANTELQNLNTFVFRPPPIEQPE